MANVHLLVLKGRADEAFLEPLRALRFRETRLYLGSVHENDEEGTRIRLRAAQAFYAIIEGVATECGLGRPQQSSSRVPFRPTSV